MLNWLKGKKTVILSVMGVLTAGVSFLNGDMSFVGFLQSPEFTALLACTGLGTLRMGMKSKVKEFMTGKKTYIVAGLGVLQALLCTVTGEISLMEFIQSPEVIQVIGFIGLASARAGVDKTE